MIKETLRITQKTMEKLQNRIRLRSENEEDEKGAPEEEGAVSVI